MNKTRCLLDMIKDIPDYSELWNDAVSPSNYLRNRIYSSSCNMKSVTHFEAFTGKKPDLSHLGVPGCKEYVHIPSLNEMKSCPIGHHPERWWDIVQETSTARLYLPKTEVRWSCQRMFAVTRQRL